MSDDIDWDQRRVENTLAAIDLQRLYLKAESPAWAVQEVATAERLGSQERVVSGYANLCLLLLSSIKDELGIDPLHVLDQMKDSAKKTGPS